MADHLETLGASNSKPSFQSMTSASILNKAEICGLGASVRTLYLRTS